MIKPMDERKRTVRNLEEKRREDLAALNKLLETLGAAAIAEAETGMSGQELTSEYLTEYREITREIEDAEEAVRSVERDITRIKQVEETIRRKEQEYAGRNGELADRYARLGERLLGSEAREEFALPFRQQLDALLPKIQSLEERLNVLEEKGDSNVFAWIGKSAQGMVLRSFLGKNQGNLRRIYQDAGERFILSSPEEQPGLEPEREEIEGQRRLQEALGQELNRLREECRGIGDSFGADGGPGRKIQSLERRILLARERLRELYLRCGGRLEAAGENASGEGQMEKIRILRKTIAGYERQIEQLNAALGIDEAEAEIAKLERAISAQRARIAASETTIDQYARKIDGAKERILELSKAT